MSRFARGSLTRLMSNSKPTSPSRNARLALRAALIASGLCAAPAASAQLSVIYGLNFDAPTTPWASTGTVTLGGVLGAPVLQNTDLAPGIGNTYSAVFDGNQFGFGGNFAGLDTATTGYGLQIWVKNPGSTFPSYFWQNIASFGYSADSGQRLNENGIAVGLYEGAYYGASNRALGDAGEGFPAVRSAIAPGGAGSINGWDHLAFIAEGAGGSLYVNGAFQGSRALPELTAPGSVWHLFAGLDGYPAYTGLADDLKLFTFSVGTFSAAQLDYAIVTQIPEPSAFAALFGAGALAFAAGRRRSRVRR